MCRPNISKVDMAGTALAKFDRMSKQLIRYETISDVNIGISLSYPTSWINRMKSNVESDLNLSKSLNDEEQKKSYATK